MTLDQRLTLLRETSGVKESYVEEYKKGEGLRYAINSVKKNAAAYDVARHSPKKMYGNVKSKVGGNIKTIKKTLSKSIVSSAKMVRNDKIISEQNGPTYSQARASPGTVTTASSAKKSVMRQTLTSAKKRTPLTQTSKSMNKVTSGQFKSQLAEGQMESIISQIRSRLGKDVITAMD